MSNSEAIQELDYLLHRVPLLQAFSSSTAEELATRISERKAPAGTMIFEEGATGSELYIVRRGRVKIFVSAGAQRDEAVLAVLGEGEFFGELSLLDGSPRSASAVAIDDTILLCLHHDDFYAALQKDFHAARHVITVLCRRLRDTDVRLASAAVRDVRERLADCLWNLALHSSQPTKEGLLLNGEISDGELARQVGATTGRIQMELSRLTRDFVIKRVGAELTVLKPNDLRDMARSASSVAAITVPEWLLG